MVLFHGMTVNACGCDGFSIGTLDKKPHAVAERALLIDFIRREIAAVTLFES